MIERQLAVEPKPRMRPFLTARVLRAAARRRDARRLTIMRAYWLLALAALGSIGGPWTVAVALAALAGAAVVATPASRRRWLRVAGFD